MQIDLRSVGERKSACNRGFSLRSVREAAPPFRARMRRGGVESAAAREREYVEELRACVGEHAGVIDFHHMRLRRQLERGPARETRLDLARVLASASRETGGEHRG